MISYEILAVPIVGWFELFNWTYFSFRWCLFATDSQIIKKYAITSICESVAFICISYLGDWTFFRSDDAWLRRKIICHRFTDYKIYPIASIWESVAFICIFELFHWNYFSFRWFLFATDSQIIKNIRLHQFVNLWHSFAFRSKDIEALYA